MKSTSSLRRRISNVNKLDGVFIIFCFTLSIYYAIYISIMKVPVWDGTVYLLNAKSWLNNIPLFEEFRPQLLSWLIAGR